MVLVGKPEERDHWGDLGVDGKDKIRKDIQEV